MLGEVTVFEFDSDNELVKSVAYAPCSCPLYSKIAVGTRSSVYIFSVLYEKSAVTGKYHPKQQPVLIGKIVDDTSSSFEIVSVMWNAQGSSLSVQYTDGRIFIYQRESTWNIFQPITFRGFQLLLETDIHHLNYRRLAGYTKLVNRQIIEIKRSL